ncbi:MBL fold metallo-hydrolase [Vallitalea okinawensis]|uniref:MBL fold metallo-hydrolase n=1 Tax=Vallitalea okinawensis TaxID=2078660 RepID=UPI000CFB9EC0|nr:MBL fold metallo-hydrolase [Vallitalea okinawensis]
MFKHVLASNYFNLYRVTENVYAAIKTNDLCMGNAGFINLGDKVVVFDTFLSIEAAKELKQAIINITNCTNFIIINSHSHIDHYLGNCVFPDQTTIISSEIAYPKFIENNEEIKLEENLYDKEIRDLDDKLNTLTNRDDILDTNNFLIIYKNLNHPECKLINPNVTFKDNLSIHGSLDSIDLRVIPTAHSHGDIIATTLDKSVAFVGDLLFIDEHPYLGAGDPIKLIKELRTLLHSEIKHFIPGHGPICSKEQISEQIEYIETIITLVKENLKDSDNLKASDLPSKYHHYKGPCFRWNINFLTDYLKESKEIDFDSK